MDDTALTGPVSNRSHGVANGVSDGQNNGVSGPVVPDGIPVRYRGLWRGNPGNRGGQPGRSGDKTAAWKARVLRAAQSPKILKALRETAEDPSSKHWPAAAGHLLDRAYPKEAPVKAVAQTTVVVLNVRRRDE